MLKAGNMSLRSLRALCLTSFFIADVRDGLGPFLGIFLTQRHWQSDDIGLLMTLGGVAGLLATLPAGFITDTSKNKRTLLALLCIMITASTLLLWFSQQNSVVALSQMVSGICAAFVGPLITGITLGLTGQRGFNAQMGKNEAFNHAGNFFTALIAGGIAWYWGVGGIFLLMACTTVLTLCALLAIRSQDIDNDAARGIQSSVPQPLPGLSVLTQNRALLITGLTLMLFHLANAALLPMLSMRVAAAPGAMNPGLYAAATVIISQAVMIPVAIWVARRIDKYGYWRLIMLALLIMPLRAALAATSAAPLMMVPVQILDGAAAGILGVVVPGFIVALLCNSGHVNAGQSVVMLMQGVGASMSPALTGMIAGNYSFATAFSVLSAIALVALLIWWRYANVLIEHASARALKVGAD
ncbi:Major Facilitator Superfamily protein [Kosakonia radicincitans]|uniref:Major Facilitator Superfamily protein n=2 Tax=Kosakonia radicincitans TaxID=283686 RepID=A0AAX2EPE4_9ENTR|nr:Major Facilitator Superfamily protein [Kosakonia radicincitans]SFR04629.1 Major Facilitator Superfamily protein [Kosakonia radicincitans]SFT55371.1 Major Facilitator Superfamily protein [Kosakonia radicincitans]SFX36020.1 Major Facilitator Superfamily protein [Kosakonia radicincitans]